MLPEPTGLLFHCLPARLDFLHLTSVGVFVPLPSSVLPSSLSLLQATESELGDVDLSGLPEAAVDSEEEEEEDEDLERASDTLLGRDLVRECLEKDPVDRNDDDIGQSESLLPLFDSHSACKGEFLLFVCHQPVSNKLRLYKIYLIVKKQGAGTVCACMSHLRRTVSCYF